MKISLDSDHQSKNGIIKFNDEASALKAIDVSAYDKNCVAEKLELIKEKYQSDTVIAINFHGDSKKCFEDFGKICGFYDERTSSGLIVFVQYYDDSDKEYGSKCAEKAIQFLKKENELESPING